MSANITLNRVLLIFRRKSGIRRALWLPGRRTRLLSAHKTNVHRGGVAKIAQMNVHQLENSQPARNAQLLLSKFA